MTAVTAGAETIQDLVADATAAGTPLRIAGRSHWIDAGRPVAATRIASLATHAGVIDYVPGDLTITIRSGTTLSEIERVTAAEGQWFPVDPHGSPDGTIGATISTGSFGPRAHAFGRIRDLVLGAEFVTGDGRIVRGGGRVVKNVAGFDLVRLITGSWGTLGVITEATLRLYSKPDQPVTLAMDAPGLSAALAQRIESILSAPATPFAVEIVDASLAVLLGLPRRTTVLAELGGNSAAVIAQRDALSRLGPAEELPSMVWSAFRIADDSVAGSIVVRISSLPAMFAAAWVAASESLASIDGSLMHGTPALGIVRCILPAATALADVKRLAESMPGTTIIYERLPAAMWAVLSPSIVSDRLSRDIRTAFDPRGILNPGILGPVS